MIEMTRPDLYILAERHGFPRVPLRPGESVAPGRENWEKFVELGWPFDIAKASKELEARDE